MALATPFRIGLLFGLESCSVRLWQVRYSMRQCRPEFEYVVAD